MAEKSKLKIIEYFEQIPDPRIDRRKKHTLIDIIICTVIATLCGCENWIEIESFCKKKEEDLKKILELKNGIPSHDTFDRVFSIISAKLFQDAFFSWANEIRKNLGKDIIAIDGKAVNTTGPTHSFLSLLHAWSSNTGLIIGAVECEKGAGEVPKIPDLLESLEIKDCIVTVDAGNARSSVAKAIIEKKGDYVMTVKGNEKSLCKKLENIFSGSYPDSFLATEEEKTELNRERIEYRRCVSADASQFDHLDLFDRWPELKSIGFIEHVRIKDAHSTLTRRYFISSLSSNAKQLMKVSRIHWGVEKMNWILDVAFKEDDNREKNKVSAKNLALIRRMTVGLLKSAKEKLKRSYRVLLKECGWDFEFAKQVLFGEF